MLKKFFIQFGTALISASVVAYLLLQLVLNVGDVVDFEYATYAEISDTAEVTAYIFRSEKVLEGTATGTDCYLVSDGEKVSMGEPVVITYSDETDAGIQKRIAEIDEKLRILQKSSLTEGASTTDLSKLDEKIDSVLIEIIQETDSGNLDSALRKKEDLLVLMNRRNAIVKSTGGYHAQISTLLQEKTSLQSSLTGASVTVTATEAGYYQPVTDGYENAFTVDELETLTLAKFDALVASKPNEQLIATAAGKIITNSEWFMVCAVTRRMAVSFNDGRTYDIVFPYSADARIPMTLKKTVSQTDSETVLLVFSSRMLPEGFDFSRRQAVELVLDSYAGVRISSSCLRVKDGITGVYTLDGNRVVFKEADAVFESEGYVICKIPVNPYNPTDGNKAYISSTQLSLYDAVLKSGMNIYEGKVLR